MTKNPVKYLIIGFSALFIIVFALYFFQIISTSHFNSSIAALLLNFANSLLAFWLFHKSHNKNNVQFLAANLGGMGLRVFFLLVSVALVILFLNIEKISFILLFFIFYFILLSLEVAFFVKKVEEKKKSRTKENVI